MNTKTLSVVMPNYNHADYLPQALEALFEQSYPPTEVIIVDDASTDNSIEVIQNYAERYPAIRLIRNEKNSGPIRAFRKGWDEIKGDYFYLASADDKVLPGLFEKCMKLLTQYPEAGVCTGLVMVQDGNNQYLMPSRPYVANSPSFFPPDEVLDALIKKEWCLIAGSAVWRTKAAREAKAFPLEVENYLDEFAIILISLNYGACFIPEPLSLYRISSRSFSSRMRDDLTTFEGCLTNASTIMETTYGDKFPSAFVTFFKKRNQYNHGIAALTNLEISQNNCIEQTRNMIPDQNILDRLFFSVEKIFIKAQKILSRIYWFFRLGNNRWFRMKRFLLQYINKPRAK